MGKEIRVGIPPPGRKIKKSKKEVEESKKEVEEHIQNFLLIGDAMTKKKNWRYLTQDSIGGYKDDERGVCHYAQT